MNFLIILACMGMAFVAAVTNMDHAAHLDTQVRAFGLNGKAVLQPHVRFSAN